ncbi:antitoxin Xre/MbcA/ParS toxin-binding domain-containing protein [Azospirillum brasilense]|uniref:antitoxin Xre/MbcA/ParS toxin-binding domain-containing protein n=1 Tax=Azospirillum brasilense TaxID=192 RepID=UPI000E0B3960|nr:antitoxin Xre/MbcA/ParS toxin-binding domain-containing protein [Azospirillum brasilense]
MIRAEMVAEVLGGERLIGRPVHSLADLSDAVDEGLPKSTLGTVVKRVTRDPRHRRTIMYGIVPEATYKRRRDRLSRDESERTERLARITAHALSVWGVEADAQDFLAAPHPMLGGRTPVEAAVTDLGARQVEQILAAIEYGLPV